MAQQHLPPPNLPDVHATPFLESSAPSQNQETLVAASIPSAFKKSKPIVSLDKHISEGASEETTFQTDRDLSSPQPQKRSSGDNPEGISSWKFELGLGGTYLSVQSNSNFGASDASGFNGPSSYLGVGRSIEDLDMSLALTNVYTKMKINDGSQSSSQTLNWTSAWAGVAVSHFTSWPKIEYGISYHHLPLIYTKSDTALPEVEASTNWSMTIGFNARYVDLENGLWFWDQRILIPDSATRLGTEGSLGYFHCLTPYWSAGAVLSGQYTGVSSDSENSNLYNTALQIRLRSGACVRRQGPSAAHSGLEL